MKRASIVFCQAHAHRKQCWDLTSQRTSNDEQSRFLEAMTLLSAHVRRSSARVANSRRAADACTQEILNPAASLADLSSRDDGERFSGTLSPQHHHFEFTERKHAGLVGTAYQAVVFTAALLPKNTFLMWQRAIEVLFLDCEPKLLSTVSSVEALSPLSQLLRLSAADAYLGLLVHRHNVPPTSGTAFKAMLQSLQRRSVGLDNNQLLLNSMSLPLGPRFPHIQACWRSSLSILSWAVDGLQKSESLQADLGTVATSTSPLACVTETDIQHTLRSVLFSSGDRANESLKQKFHGGSSAMTHSADVVGRLIQLLRASTISTKSKIDQLVVFGKKFQFVIPSEDGGTTEDDKRAPPSITPHMASEALFAGQWHGVLAAFSTLLSTSLSSIPPVVPEPEYGAVAGAIRSEVAPAHMWPFYRGYFRCTSENRQRLRALLESQARSLRRGDGTCGVATRDAQHTVAAFHFRHIIPHSTPKPLVRFEGHGSYRALSYIDRSSLWELLPFAVVAGCCSGDDSVLSAVRTKLILPLLQMGSTTTSTPTAPMNRSGATPPVVWVKHYQSLGDLMTTGHAVNFLSLLVPELRHHRRIVRELYRPWWMPLDTLRSLVASLHSSFESANAPSEGCELSLLDNRCKELISTLRDTVPAVLDGRVAHMSSLQCEASRHYDNYWFSAWIEATISVGPLESALGLLGALTGSIAGSAVSCEERDAPLTCPVLSPECAVAVTTALISLATHRHRRHRVATAKQSPQAHHDAISSVASQIRRDLKLPEHLLFAVPLIQDSPETDETASGLAGVRRYFRWIHKNEFYSAVSKGPPTTPSTGKSANGMCTRDGVAGNAGSGGEQQMIVEDAVWDSALGLLGGRFYRMSTHLPTVSRKQGTHFACKMRLWKLNIDAILAFGWESGKNLSHADLPVKAMDTVAPAVVDTNGVEIVAPFDVTPITAADGNADDGAGPAGHGRPSIVVLLKPSGISTTLHHSGPSVSTFLAMQGLWWCPSPQEDATRATGGACNNDDETGASVLAQEGLVNRIDRGTSGLVIAACEPKSLLRQRRIQLVQQGSTKTYYAIVVHMAPSDRAVGTSGLWTPQSCPFFLPPRGVIGGVVFAEGANFSARISAQYQNNGGSDGGADGDAVNEATKLRQGHFHDKREASTTFTVVEAFYPKQKRRYPFLSVPHYLVRVQLTSGRRHQIRQHFASIHHPLLGDVQYHPRAASDHIQRPALHAGEVTVWGCGIGDGEPPEGSTPQDNDVSVSDVASCEAIEALFHTRRKTSVSCELPKDMRDVIWRLRKASTE